jgi:hypothetical protein
MSAQLEGNPKWKGLGRDENIKGIVATLGKGVGNPVMESYSHGQGMSTLPGDDGGK